MWCIVFYTMRCLLEFISWFHEINCSWRWPFSVWQAARCQDMDDIVSLASAGVLLDSKDSHSWTGYNFRCLYEFIPVLQFELLFFLLLMIKSPFFFFFGWFPLLSFYHTFSILILLTHLTCAGSGRYFSSGLWFSPLLLKCEIF